MKKLTPILLTLLCVMFIGNTFGQSKISSIAFGWQYSDWSFWPGGTKGPVTLSNGLSMSSTSGLGGGSSGEPNTIFHSDVSRGYIYTDDNDEHEYIITGFDNSKKYQLEFFSSREMMGTSRITIFRVGSDEVSIEADGNTNETKKITNISPIDGTITFYMRKAAGAPYGYLNAMFIYEEDSGNSNSPPVADAGSNVTIQLSTNTCSLEGSGSSDPDGDPLTYTWSQYSGPTAASIATPAAVSTEVSNFQVGTYTFEVTVNDGTESSSDMVSVTVLPDLMNIAQGKPVSTNSMVSSGVEVIVDGIEDGSYTNGTAFIINGDANGHPRCDIDLGAVYEIKNIEVWNCTDDGEKEELHDFLVVVRVPPFASIYYSDNANDIYNNWQFFQGSYPDPNINLEVNDYGRYVRIIASDIHGHIPLAEVKVMVEPQYVNVTGVLLSSNIVNLTYIGEKQQLSETVLPADASNKSVVWISSDPSIVTVDEAGQITAQANGTATVTVTTQAGRHTAQCQVDVNDPLFNYPPVADAGSYGTIILPVNNTTTQVTLDATNSTDSDGSISYYEWQVNGVTVYSGNNPTCAHSFQAGTHNIRLMVRDDNEDIDYATTTITVTEPSLGSVLRAYWDMNHGIYQADANVGIGATPKNDAKLRIMAEYGVSPAQMPLYIQAHTSLGNTYPYWEGVHAKMEIRPDLSYESLPLEMQAQGGLQLSVSGDAGSSWRNNLFMSTNGRIGIGTFDPQTKLDVNGNLAAEEVFANTKVRTKRLEVTTDVAVTGAIEAGQLHLSTVVPQSDYVFEEDYHLMKYSELQSFIKKNKHLPEVPSAKDFQENGYNVGEMDDVLLRKIEELTLYILELEDRLRKLEQQ